jgi:hypothetical protein
MSDPLSQLLRQAAAHTPPPTLNSASLPARIRQSAEKQFRRRIATGTVAAIPMLVYILLIASHHLHPTEKPLAQIDTSSSTDLALQIAYHERVASLLETYQQAATYPSRPTDAFLEQLQLDRSKAALVLLKSAEDEFPDQSNTAQTIARLHQTIALFPDTPAAHLATQQITQLQNSRRQS